MLSLRLKKTTRRHHRQSPNSWGSSSHPESDRGSPEGGPASRSHCPPNTLPRAGRREEGQVGSPGSAVRGGAFRDPEEWEQRREGNSGVPLHRSSRWSEGRVPRSGSRTPVLLRARPAKAHSLLRTPPLPHPRLLFSFPSIDAQGKHTGSVQVPPGPTPSWSAGHHSNWGPVSKASSHKEWPIALGSRVLTIFMTPKLLSTFFFLFLVLLLILT